MLGWQRVAWETIDTSLAVTDEVQDLWRAVVEEESGTGPFLAYRHHIYLYCMFLWAKLVQYFLSR